MRFRNTCGEAVDTLFDNKLESYRTEWGTRHPPSQASRTSREAAEKIRPSTEILRGRVLAVIEAAGTDGLTDHECQQILDMNPSTQRPRRIELANAGFISKKLDSIYNPVTRKTPSGRRAQVWVARTS